MTALQTDSAARAVRVVWIGHTRVMIRPATGRARATLQQAVDYAAKLHGPRPCAAETPAPYTGNVAQLVRVADMVRDGRSCREIAATLGVTYNAAASLRTRVRLRLARGLPVDASIASGQPPRLALRADVVAAYNAGAVRRVVAEQMGVPVHVVDSALSAARVAGDYVRPSGANPSRHADRNARVCALRDAGGAIEDIARDMRMTPHAVKNVLRRRTICGGTND
jgi:DNA-binding CsgD family transcriptional regulator